ncbi:conserved hypothetical protein [Methanocaldococcus vulcanius M7]|uniref:CRISPR type III-B/RAMP module-associated protein Cmr5 n=1 Tax=Methanocaldococcus vulcanius (strain ATCC 700851 / DSM 12094 / M7) TaxID=579137 RepID=C9RHU8_METVM|nr:hypothetical protein [Methanocaldococcus vulcanius]ACX73150.1 conserved hypothetical protein [Methanocaldococcus vulcanius M7]
MGNLEMMINNVAFKIVKEIENMKKEEKEWKKYKNEIEKALGVLSNDGVYAYWVYCKSKEIDKIFIEKIEPLMKYTKTTLNDGSYEEYFQKLSNDINDLLFFKEILERTLILARYHAKALGDD